MSEIETMDEEAIWHEVECGGYAADLVVWSRLASEASGPILELGAGTGRVALHLAAAGFEVTALDRSAPLLRVAAERAAVRGLELATVQADARDLADEREFALVLAPMQFAHLLSATERATLLERCRAALAPGGTLALALLAEAIAVPAAGPPLLPDVREIDGWVFSSQPIEVREVGGGVEVRRLRQRVSPDGSLSESLDVVRLEPLSAQRLESEARAAGLEPRERVEVPPTEDHVGSTVVVLEAP